MTQLATSINDLRGHGGRLPAQEQQPRKENLSKVTLRLGKELKGLPPRMPNGPKETSEQGSRRARETSCPIPTTLPSDFEEDEIDEHIIVTPEGISYDPPREIPNKTNECLCLGKECQMIKVSPPFPGRLENKGQKESDMDYMAIFEQLEVKIPFLEAVKLPSISKFLKDIMVGRIKEDERLVVN